MMANSDSNMATVDGGFGSDVVVIAVVASCWWHTKLAQEIFY